MKWKEPFDILDLEPHVDPRGLLFEILRFKDNDIPGEGQLYTFSIQPGARRGDHYHLKKKEWFACVHGKVKVLLSSMEGVDKVIEISTEHPKVVYVGMGTTHALINETNTIAVIVSYGSKQHDPVDVDTYRKVAFEKYK